MSCVQPLLESLAFDVAISHSWLQMQALAARVPEAERAATLVLRAFRFKATVAGPPVPEA